jgi:hypothetical protein
MKSLVLNKYLYLPVLLVAVAGLMPRPASAVISTSDVCFGYALNSANRVQCFSTTFNTDGTDWLFFETMDDAANFQGPGYNVTTTVSAVPLVEDLLQTVGWKIDIPAASGTYFVFGNHSWTDLDGVPAILSGIGEFTSP